LAINVAQRRRLKFTGHHPESSQLAVGRLQSTGMTWVLAL